MSRKCSAHARAKPAIPPTETPLFLWPPCDITELDVGLIFTFVLLFLRIMKRIRKYILSMLPVIRKEYYFFWEVSRLPPFVLLVRITYRWGMENLWNGIDRG